MCTFSHSVMSNSVAPWIVACQAPLPVEFSRQEYWSVLSFPSPTSVWDECSCVVVWACLALPFFGIGMKTDISQSCSHCWVFQICWHIECRTFTASSLRIWNSSTGILSPLLSSFIVMLPKAHLTSHPRILALGEWSHHCDYLGNEDFCTVLCILATSS